MVSSTYSVLEYKQFSNGLIASFVESAVSVSSEVEWFCYLKRD